MSAKDFLGRIVDSLATTGIVRTNAQRSAERVAQLLRTLASQRGEASGAVLARRAVGLYNRLDAAARLHFFDLLARDFSPDRNAVLEAAVAYHRDGSPENLERLQRIAEPSRQEIFRRMNMAPGGTATLLALRRELLQAMKDTPALVVVDRDLEHLLASWFNRGFLELRRIDWNTPASILEKLIAYEAVHEIHGFPDLKRRLQRDRRCFAFFHPALADEPLIFVEVALVDEMPDDVAPILAMESDVGDPKRARCAVFYSITSTQPGLRGVSFGNFLIKQVAEDLHAELPTLKLFATLSPIPGFRKWAEREARNVPAIADSGLPNAEHDREVLERLAAHYLTREWEAGQACDPVARFHLGNGARLERINWRADVSRKGLAQSYAMMVNYVYDLRLVERNHEEYVNRHHVVCSGEIDKLARAAEPYLARTPTAPSAPVPG
jgi:malonyl-CoA decarboxylase